MTVVGLPISDSVSDLDKFCAFAAFCSAVTCAFGVSGYAGLPVLGENIPLYLSRFVPTLLCDEGPCGFRLSTNSFDRLFDVYSDL
jgi:hypothetical protein